jgi:hypothetical protein
MMKKPEVKNLMTDFILRSRFSHVFLRLMQFKFPVFFTIGIYVPRKPRNTALATQVYNAYQTAEHRSLYRKR